MDFFLETRTVFWIHLKCRISILQAKNSTYSVWITFENLNLAAMRLFEIFSNTFWKVVCKLINGPLVHYCTNELLCILFWLYNVSENAVFCPLYYFSEYSCQTFLPGIVGIKAKSIKTKWHFVSKSFGIRLFLMEKVRNTVALLHVVCTIGKYIIITAMQVHREIYSCIFVS